jgi:hypothetical protein
MGFWNGSTAETDSTHMHEHPMETHEDSLHMETEEMHDHDHDHDHAHDDKEGSDHVHEYQEMTEQEKTLLFHEERREEAYKSLQQGEEKVKSYYEETGMYAFDMVPDHWYDPANKADLRNQSIFLGIAIIILSLLLKFWKV